jgi:hypothetical protein
MEDVLEVDAHPYDPESPVVGVDEKAKEWQAQVREPLAAQRGQVRKQAAEYPREGTANIFLWGEPRAGRRGGKVTERRCNGDFAELLRDLTEALDPTAKTIVRVVDNLNTQGPHWLYERFGPAKPAAWPNALHGLTLPSMGRGLISPHAHSPCWRASARSGGLPPQRS